ncbi:MAG: hypothetical protein GXO71_02095 [Caldiserica bacterium]|nr:hypothetical protein [Caldisericota bacterium]
MESRLGDVIKKSFFLSMGIIALTQEKVKGLVNELIEKGEITESQGKKIAEEITKKAQETREVMEKNIEKIVLKIIKKANIVTNKDLKKLEKRVAELEKKIS